LRWRGLLALNFIQRTELELSPKLSNEALHTALRKTLCMPRMLNLVLF